MNEKRFLGVDYGSKKIGLAIGVADWVHPFKVIANTPNHKLETQALEQIMLVIQEEKITDVIFGLPFSKLGDSGAINTIKRFAERLSKKISSDIAIHFVDESGTTKSSREKIIEYGVAKSERNVDDAYAACEILNRWMEETPLN